VRLTSPHGQLQEQSPSPLSLEISVAIPIQNKIVRFYHTILEINTIVLSKELYKSSNVNTDSVGHFQNNVNTERLIY